MISKTIKYFKNIYKKKENDTHRFGWLVGEELSNLESMYYIISF